MGGLASIELVAGPLLGLELQELAGFASRSEDLMQTVDEVGVKYGDQLYVGIPTSPRSPLGGRTSLSLVTLVDLVQYLKKMPVEARTRSMLVDIEEAMDSSIAS